MVGGSASVPVPIPVPAALPAAQKGPFSPRQRLAPLQGTVPGTRCHHGGSPWSPVAPRWPKKGEMGGGGSDTRVALPLPPPCHLLVWGRGGDGGTAGTSAWTVPPPVLKATVSPEPPFVLKATVPPKALPVPKATACPQSHHVSKATMSP